MLRDLLALLGGALLLVRLVQCAELGPLIACQLQRMSSSISACDFCRSARAATTRLICSIAAFLSPFWTRRSNCASASSSAFFKAFCVGTAAWKISSRRLLCSGLQAALVGSGSEFHHFGGFGPWDWLAAGATARNRPPQGAEPSCEDCRLHNWLPDNTTGISGDVYCKGCKHIR